MNTIYNTLIQWMEPLDISEGIMMWPVRLAAILMSFLVAFILDRICRKLMIPIVRRITSRTETIWDDHLLNNDVLNALCGLILPITLCVMVPYVFGNDLEIYRLMMKVCAIYMTIKSISLVCTLITSLHTISTKHEKFKGQSLKGFYQMLKLITVCIGVIIIISTLIDKNPLAILTGLGAGTAILMLVFQDTIKGLVAGIQLMANEMLSPGDWITVPKYGADGDVIEVTLTTVKVRNWDKTIVTVPPYALVNDSFQNWKGMFESGGRRIKRSINIDMQTVRFCTTEELERYSREPWMEGHQPTSGDVVNLYIFRHYLEYYLKHHPKVSQELIMTVRQLQPTAQGLPIELYFFSADTAWLNYEHLQAEVFDHVLAMLHTFDLKVFQSPSGADIQRL